ncbi:MAG TPA: SBBP repeat-containing protein, partial [Bacteroidia bacterium]|nr:SBBP repeat-containing protein [Bacteroidia bacterium]
MKKTLLTIFVMATTLLVQAQTPAFEWVQQVGDSAGDQGRSIARDAAGNLYVAGCFGKTVDFDPGPGVYNLTSSVGLELFVLKLDTAGNFEWAVKTTGWIGNLSEVALTCSDAGNVFVTGHFKDSVDFDPGSATFNLTSNGGRDIFIWHLNTNGNFVWAKNIGSTASSINSRDVGYDITTDNWGNVYTIGSFELSADFDPGPGVVTLNAGPYCDIFISKLNATGDFVWAKNFGGFNYCIGNSIAIDALGNVHATGSFSDTVDFDPGAGVFNLIAPRSNQFVASDPDIFILKLDSTGNFIWAQNFGATSEDVGQAISVDANGNVFTTGYFEDAVDFEWGNGTFNLTTSIFEDVFVLKSDAAGNFLWAKQIVSSSFYDAGNGIATDVAGNVYITGSFAGTADLDPGIDSAFVTAASSSPDIYILKLDAGGNFLWGGRAGDIGNDAGEEIVTDASGNIFTAGSFSRTADFDFNTGVNNLTTVNTLSNVYVLKMNQNNVGIYENMIQNKFTVYPNPATNI